MNRIADPNHIFMVRIGKNWYRDARIYKDDEFDSIMAANDWRMPFNLKAYHYNGVAPHPYVQEMTMVSLGIADLFETPAVSQIRIKTTSTQGYPRVIKYSNRYAIIETDFAYEYGKVVHLDGVCNRLTGKFRPVPLSWRIIKDYVNRYHRHNCAPPGHKFSIGATLGNREALVGGIIASEPKARHNMDGYTLELNRCCVDRLYYNACSFLYRQAIRAGKEMGYTRFITYTQLSEHGASLSAAGFRLDGIVPGNAFGWSRSSRKRELNPRHPLGDKKRWKLEL